MLQRAASNAYNWWWASHIRTKQSKWLSNDLQEMEERVKSMIKLIEQDADSFARKAEMYYKRRPELIQCVKETFSAYKALADRYDRISGELHKANHTIATAFPDHVQLMEDEDDDRYPKAVSSLDSTNLEDIPPEVDPTKLPNPPPEYPQISSRSKPSQIVPKKTHLGSVVTSEYSPEKAQEEIDKLQKGILILQTEKEFVKSSYERGLAKYWDIERQMTEMQEKISHLHDEFGASSVIDDDEARALMAATAIKSCEDTWVNLREQQKRSVQQAKCESERIKVATRKLKVLKGEEVGEVTENDTATSSTTLAEEIGYLKHERMELQSICAKVKIHFERCSDSSVVELANKIDELVDKVIGLEGTVSSQTAQIERLSLETNELQKHIRGLEEDKLNLSCDSDIMGQRLKQAEEELEIVQDLERSVHEDTEVLDTHFTDVCHSLNDLSEKFQSPKQTEHPFEGNEAHTEKIIKTNQIEQEDVETRSTVEDPDWVQLLMNGVKGNEKVLLHEYASILHNYKETKDMLTEIDKRNQECHSETMHQLQELRNANAIKDEEITTLRHRLFSSESWRARSMRKKSSQEKIEGLFVVAPDKECEVSEQLAKEVDKLCQVDQSASPVEQKFRAEIDTLLEENLDFWLRFSTSYHQIQKFECTFKELQMEIDNAREPMNLEDTMREEDSAPSDKKLRDLNSELQVWLEKNVLLQGELKSRFSSLCNIQEEIAKVLKASENEKVQFTRYQAAKFQGEVINMQQENNKVAKELQTGLDHVRGIQAKVGRALSKLHESFQLSVSVSQGHHPLQLRHLSTKSRVPLRTFLFGAKPKKPSLFSCMNPAFQKQNSDMGTRRIPR